MQEKRNCHHISPDSENQVLIFRTFDSHTRSGMRPILPNKCLQSKGGQGRGRSRGDVCLNLALLPGKTTCECVCLSCESRFKVRIVGLRIHSSSYKRNRLSLPLCVRVCVPVCLLRPVRVRCFSFSHVFLHSHSLAPLSREESENIT